MTTVAFVGLGRMGLPMATRLLDAGFELRVYNRTAARAQPLVERGATACRSPAEAARAAQILVTMLADDRALRETALGEQGFVGALPAGGLHLAMTTASADVTRELAALHGQRGSTLVAAPVAGRPDVAATGQLWILAAGPAGAQERCAPLFAAMSRAQTWFGEDPGLANVAKLAFNFLLLGFVETLGESLTLFEKSGGDRTRYLDTVAKIVGSPMIEGYGRRMLSGSFEPAAFAARLALKDARLALAQGDAAAVPLPIASAVRDRLLTALARGRGDADLSGLVEIARQDAGLS